MVGSDIAREEKPLRRPGLLCDFEFDGGGTEQMPGVPEARANARCDPDPFAIAHGPELREARLRVLGRVDRLHGVLAALFVAAIELRDFAFLDVAGIGQHHRAEIGRCGCRENGAGVAVLDELRNEAAVIDMRVRQDHRVDIFRREREGPVVQLLLRLGSLKHAAVDENAGLACVEQEARTRDRMRGAMEGKLESHAVSRMRSARGLRGREILIAERRRGRRAHADEIESGGLVAGVAGQCEIREGLVEGPQVAL